MSKPSPSVVRNRTRRPKRANLPTRIYPLPMLRTSERGTFKRCRWLWYQEYHEHIKPVVDIPPFRFGGLIHEALATYYKPGIRRGPRPQVTFERLYEDDLTDAAGNNKSYSKPEIDQAWADARDLGYDMLEAYWEKYHPDPEWRVIVTEYPFKTPISHPKRGTPWFYYVGILDGVWEHRPTSRYYVPDHKTTVSIQTNYLRMDNQATSYWTFGVDALMAAGLLPPNGSKPIEGILFNFLRKSKRTQKDRDPEGYVRNKPKKQNYIDAFGSRSDFNPKWTLWGMEVYAKERGVVIHGDVSKVQPAPLHERVLIRRGWNERDRARQSVLQEFEDMERVLREETNYKNPSQWTCNGCWALDMCELHEIGQDWEEFRSQTTRSWDPYHPHEIKEGR